MCLAIDIDRRSQPAPDDFPQGWRFAFDQVQRTDVGHLKGLVILPPPPNPRRYGFLCFARQYVEVSNPCVSLLNYRYVSVETAISHNPKALANVDPERFYKYVGLEGCLLQGQQKRSMSTEDQVTRNVRQKQAPAGNVEGTGGLGLALEELYERRCKQCTMCRKPSCNRCHACKENLSSQSHGDKRVCFRKVGGLG